MTIAGVLSACGGGSNSDSIEGKYVKSKKNNLCHEYIDFKDDKNLEIKTSAWSDGSVEDATYEKQENGEYKFKYQDGSSEIYNLKISDDRKELTTSEDGKSYKCEFKLE